MNTSEDKYRNKTSSGDVPPKPSIGGQNNSAELEEYGKASDECENKNDKTKEAHRFVFCFVLFCFHYLLRCSRRVLQYVFFFFVYCLLV